MADACSIECPIHSSCTGVDECTCNTGFFKHAGSGSCRAWGACEAGEYETAAPTSSTDRVCSSWTTCKPSEFETVPPTATSDRKCTQSKTCDWATQFELSPPNSATHTDRKCQDLKTCGASQYVSELSTFTSDRVCADWKTCGPSQYISKRGSKYSNQECGDLATCTGSEFEKIPAAPYRNRLCQAITICPAGHFEIKAATASTDAICKPVAACSFNEYISTPPTYTTDRKCSPLTKCKLTVEYESTAPTKTSNRFCSTIPTHTISGQVLSAFGNGIPRVHVAVVEQRKLAMTDMMGNYEITGVLESASPLTLTAWGHFPDHNLDLNLKKTTGAGAFDADKTVNFRLFHYHPANRSRSMKKQFAEQAAPTNLNQNI